MTMRVHYLQHVPFEGLGSIKPWLDARGCQLTSSALYADPVFPDPAHVDWLIIMGGPMGVRDSEQFPWLNDELEYIKACIDRDISILGICLGAQLIASALGADITRNPQREIGWHAVSRDPSLTGHPLAAIIPDHFTTFHWHGDTFAIPAHARRLAGSDVCLNQGFVYQRRVLGLQFHPEITSRQIQALIEHCAEEIVPGPCIQTAHDMTADAQRYLDDNRQLTHRLLEYLYQSDSV